MTDPAERTRASWSHAHALAMLLAILLVAGLGDPLGLVVVSVASFSTLLVLTRGRWTARGRFGPGNAVTTFRLVCILALLLTYPSLPGPALASAAILPLALDGVDGWLARRGGWASDFGALYDVEVDAFFVVALPVMLWTRGVAGPWVLIAGLWRYVYLLVFLIVPAKAPDRTRTRLGRTTYVLMIACFLLALVLPTPLARASAATATVAVSASFLRSFWERYHPPS